MHTSSNRRLLSFVILAAWALGASSVAHADNMIEVVPAKASAGVQLSIGQCPCFRWTVQVMGLGGQYETKEVLVTTDALIKFQQSTDYNFQKLASRMVSVGAIEALAKEGHIGVGSKGVTVGEAADQGISASVRVGFYMLINILQTDAVRMNIQSGYDFEKLTNMMGQQASRDTFDQAAVIKWNSGPWNGTFNAHVGFNPDGLQYTRLSAGADVGQRVLTIQDIEMNLNAGVSGSHDPFLALLGLNPNNATALVMMNLSWVSDRHHTND